MSVITTNWTQDIFLLVTLLLLGFYFYLTRNFNYWKELGVKYLPPSIFFGNIGPCILGKQSVYNFLQDIYENSEGEKLLGFYAVDRPYLLVRDPELLRHIFVKDFHNFSNRLTKSYKNDVLGLYNVFLIENPPWKQLRIKLTPFFTTGKLKKMLNMILEVNDDFLAYFNKLNIDDKIGKPIDIKEACAKMMTDFIGISAYGIRFNSLTDPNAEFRRYGKAMFRSEYLRYLQMLSIFFIPVLRPLMNPKFFDGKGSDFILKTFRHVIDERKKMQHKRDDLIDTLIQINENQLNDSYKLELDQLIAQAAIFFSAGFETSSSTISFTLYHLAKDAEMQTRLRNEILTAMEDAGGKITYNWVNTIPYLNMVLYETLRMYPVLAWLDRMTENDYTFPGTNITIKKGTPLLIPMKALHMDPKYWSDPKKFDPERFSEENKKKIVPFTFFPFGQGPRNCIGERLGILQAKMGIINFIINFEITTCKETPTSVKFDPLNIFTHMPGELYLHLRKRVN